MTTTDLTSDEALSSDLARVRQIADLTGEDPVLISIRECALYRAALRETRAALEEIRDQQLDERLELAQ